MYRLGNEAKLSDFQFSRKFKNQFKSVGNYPAWAPPEQLNALDTCTEKVDVYSYAICMYLIAVRMNSLNVLVMVEVMYPSPRPYERLTVNLLTQIANSNLRPTINNRDEWPPRLLNLVELCWANDPSHRPSFDKIKNILQEIKCSLNSKPRISAQCQHNFLDFNQFGGGCIATGRELYKSSYNNGLVLVKFTLTRLNDSVALAHKIKVLKCLHHPKILGFIGVCTDPDRNVRIVSEYLDGACLYDVLHNPSKNLTWKDNLLQFAIDICEGVLYMHSHTPPILHRAIQSENIWILENCSTAKLTYLNLACLLTDVSISRESAPWIAPEILTANADYSVESKKVLSY
ncbi:hypothetical protein THRCLA_09907 [Thraustotheca clavata]|uniref:Protein kinase domain-containing protein n=1 Tax=Thraustotheca clavata TaxID=74557 RepID=A0A1V9YTP0_9STRA|nr:hypothetical protein THRCLA_09907 [Thraustotheca clavata]